VVNFPASVTSSRFLGKKRSNWLYNLAKAEKSKSGADDMIENDINVNIEYNVNDYIALAEQPLYCICNGVSEGDMVACDNPKVIYILS
jgi:hypothetical protein